MKQNLKNMFKKERIGKTNIKSSKGGEDIGFSFCFFSIYTYTTYIFENSNSNRQFKFFF